MTHVADIAAGRLDPEQYEANFGDAHPPLTRAQALVEADRCFFCYDAPCVTACPTSIDIPSFIRKIGSDNVKGAARDILGANIMGGMCARVCPTEILCEQACVRNDKDHNPIRIGDLQRYATDWLFERGTALFERAAPTGRSVAVVGGGPAGLACAHKLATLGHEVTVFEGRSKLGGLNEYGIAAYKVPNQFAQREVDYILSIGGITVRTGWLLGRDGTVAGLRDEFDAVFLGLGLAGVNALDAAGEELAGVHDAVDFIAALRQTPDKASLPVGRRVVVIGGGNTAIDAAVQARRLGAEDVTLVYRRGPEAMSATWVEQDWAQTNGVRIKHWARPATLIGEDGQLAAIELEYTRLDGEGRLIGTNERFILEADMVFKAIGQSFVPAVLNGSAEQLTLRSGRIAVDEERRTSLPGIWAGGDCIAGGQDLTVAGVEDGKQAALSIHRWLEGRS